ncbi:MAG: hypothetical protein ACREJQ_00965, partial [bacterium]
PTYTSPSGGEENTPVMGWMDAREASGTVWQPASTPHRGIQRMYGKYTLIFHWMATLDYDHQGGPQGETEIGSHNWVMAMATRPTGEGRLSYRAMFSLEPVTQGKNGYPELFQTGEALRGVFLVNRQHPHDLFMELSMSYQRPLNAKTGWHVYLAPVGEPALGPPGFPHRLSASMNMEAPLGHHQQDSTHVAFGVVTAGVTTGQARIEASVFNGREPDDQRWDLDFGPLDSYSTRVSYNPTPKWSFQVSAGHLVEPEELKPGVSANRQTASALYTRSSPNGFWANSLIWGNNHEEQEAALTTLTLESLMNARREYFFARLESAQRMELPGLAEGERATVGVLTLGLAHDFYQTDRGAWAVGGQASFYRVPDKLKEIYGDPVSYHIFVQWRPPRMHHAAIGMDEEMPEMDMRHMHMH